MNNRRQKTVPKIGLIGCGRWGKNILRDLLTLGCEVHVAEHNIAGRQQAEKMGAHSVVRNETELETEVDGYIVAVHTARHQDMLEYLAPSRKPVFVEKPMVPNNEAVQIIDALMGDRVFVMHKWRYHPGVQALRDLVRSEQYGNVRRLTTSRLQWDQPHQDVDAFWILMPHDVSIVFHILGQLPPVRHVQTTKSGEAIHAMTAHLGHCPGVQMEISALYPETKRMISVYFEKTVVSLCDPLADHLDLRHFDANGRPVGKREKIPISTEYPLLRELSAFIAYLNGGEKPMSNIADEQAIMVCLNELRSQAFDNN